METETEDLAQVEKDPTIGVQRFHIRSGNYRATVEQPAPGRLFQVQVRGDYSAPRSYMEQEAAISYAKQRVCLMHQTAIRMGMYQR